MATGIESEARRAVVMLQVTAELDGDFAERLAVRLVVMRKRASTRIGIRLNKRVTEPFDVVLVQVVEHV